MPVPTPAVPADVAARFAAMFERLRARGLLESVAIYARTTQLDGNNKPVARPKTQLGILDAYVEAVAGSTSQDAQDRNQRQMDSHTVFFKRDVSTAALITPENYGIRWAVLLNRDTRERRFLSLQAMGPYLYGTVVEGGTSDPVQ